MDEILHHFETTGNHCLLVLQGNRIIPGFLGWCEMDFATLRSFCCVILKDNQSRHLHGVVHTLTEEVQKRVALQSASPVQG